MANEARRGRPSTRNKKASRRFGAAESREARLSRPATRPLCGSRKTGQSKRGDQLPERGGRPLRRGGTQSERVGRKDNRVGAIRRRHLAGYHFFSSKGMRTVSADSAQTNASRGSTAPIEFLPSAASGPCNEDLIAPAHIRKISLLLILPRRHSRPQATCIIELSFKLANLSNLSER